jgi:aspartate kinase
VPAISFTGSQAGVMTDESHSSARILEVRPIRVREELDRGRIVVLAGFQGVNPVTKEITTLGRGGSDTTAVAVAAVLKAECCEIIKEVDGVCSADPRILHVCFPVQRDADRKAGRAIVPNDLNAADRLAARPMSNGL